MNGYIEPLALAAAVTLVGLLVTGLYRAAARRMRALSSHLAAIAQLPAAINDLTSALSAHDQRLTRLENGAPTP